MNRDAVATNTSDGTVLRLSRTSGFSSGSVFSQTQVNANNFSTKFQFRISNASGATDSCNAQPGADGIVFVVQSVDSSLGGAGQGIGYEGIEKSVGVEFDTWCNTVNNDPSSNHIAIDTLGALTTVLVPLIPSTSPPTSTMARFGRHGSIIMGKYWRLESARPTYGQPPQRFQKRWIFPNLFKEAQPILALRQLRRCLWKSRCFELEYRPFYQPIDGSNITITATTRRQANVGSEVVIYGSSTSFSAGDDATSRRIEFVTINGKPVEVLDANGNFFTRERIKAGGNSFTIAAHDVAQQSVTVTLDVEGLTNETEIIDFSQLDDITSGLRGIYARTSFNEEETQLKVDLGIRNELQVTNDLRFATSSPLFVGISNISDPSVSVVANDGIAPNGIPYYDFSDAISGGKLLPGQLTANKSIQLHNPNRIQFTYDLVFYGKLNAPPEFTSLPDLEALAGREYVYQATAIDPDDDPLKFRLLESPAGMTIAELTGRIAWTPTTNQIGNYSVVIQVDDGRGGKALQRFTLSLIAAPPNRPPVITSYPVTVANVGERSQGNLSPFTAIELTQPMSDLNPQNVFSTLPTVDPSLFGLIR